MGFNYRSDELTAALARIRLERLDHHVEVARRNAALLGAGLAGMPGVCPPHVPPDRTCVFYRYRIGIDPDELGFAGPAVELRDRLLWALRAEGVAASLWQLLPLPAQPVFRRGRFASWQPGDDDRLEPWDRHAHPVAARLLESSIVLGTGERPLFNQPGELMERYLGAFEKVLADRQTLFAADHEPVQPWPPIPAGAV